MGILETVKNAGYCAVIEVANGTNSQRIGGKIYQIVKARQEISKETGAEVDAGFVYFRTSDVEHNLVTDLNFLSQLKGYEQEKAAIALARTAQRETITDKERRIIDQMLTRITDGANLEYLLYPDEQTLPQFRQEYPELRRYGSTIKTYGNTMGHIRGAVLEEYVGLALQGPGRTVLTGYQRQPRGEIDIIVAGNKRDIRAALQDENTFKIVRAMQNTPTRQTFEKIGRSEFRRRGRVYRGNRAELF